MFSKESLPKSGFCPVCHFEFKCLSQHFNSCVKKHPYSSQASPITHITLNGLKFEKPERLIN